MKRMILVLCLSTVLVTSLSGCANMTHRQKATVAGGIGGAVIGGAVGGGTGAVIGGAGGAVAGNLLAR